jgi:hypothetical protein
MKRKIIQKINLFFDQNPPTQSHCFLKKNMPIVRCKCGYEILVIPDLKAMNTVIKKHISKH